MGHKVGDRVRIDNPGFPQHGKVGTISQSAPSGHFHGVDIRGQHAGYFHESDLKAASRSAGWTPAGQKAGAAEGRMQMTNAKKAMEAHSITHSQGGTHAGHAFDESKHPRQPAGAHGGGQFRTGDRVTVKDGEGFSHGQGTVMAYHPAASAKHVPLVEVTLDDSGHTGLYHVKAVKKI